MKITIALTTYNGAKYITEQMESILSQSRKPDEVIISDDGSKDDTVQLVNRFIQVNHLEKIWKVNANKINKGYARNFIDTALMAQNDVVFFCDQDDIWELNRIAVMSTVMEENPDINLLCSNLEPFYQDEDTRKWSKKYLAQMKNDDSLERYTLDFDSFHLKRSGCTMCIRRSFLESIEPFWTENWAHDDFVWKMAVASDSCAILQYNSMKRRMHLDNASVVRFRTRKWRINQLSELEKQYQSLKRYINSLGGNADQLKVVQHNIESLHIRNKVVASKHIWDWLLLLTKYKDCYPRRKGLYLDLYLSIFRSYKGAN